MRELDWCFELAKKIRDKNETLAELKLRVASPKNQIYSDMPKGGGAYRNPNDEYLIKAERIKSQIERLQFQLNEWWGVVSEIFDKCGVTDNETITLMRLRFYNGLVWNKCVKIMQQDFPDGKWNANKCFRVYRKVLYKTHKKSD